MSDLNSHTSEPAARKPKRRFRVLLGASLALNLLFIGGLVGAIAKGPSARAPGPNSREISAPYVAAFDRETKREIRKEMRARLPKRETSIGATRSDYNTFLELLRAEAFDEARAAQVIEQQMDRAGVFLKLGRELSLEKISQMSKPERVAYADRFEEFLKTRKKRRPRKD